MAFNHNLCTSLDYLLLRCRTSQVYGEATTMSKRVASKAARGVPAPLLDTAHQIPLQSLLSRIYGKPVELHLTQVSSPSHNAELLAGHTRQFLTNRINTARRGVMDATKTAVLPTERAVTAMRQAKQLAPTVVPSAAVTKSSAWGRHRVESSTILRELKLSQVSSVYVETGGRLSKRMTANRSARKSARRGLNSKSAGFLLRGWKKVHHQSAQSSGKRRVGSFNVRVDLDGLLRSFLLRKIALAMRFLFLQDSISFGIAKPEDCAALIPSSESGDLLVNGVEMFQLLPLDQVLSEETRWQCPWPRRRSLHPSHSVPCGILGVLNLGQARCSVLSIIYSASESCVLPGTYQTICKIHRLMRSECTRLEQSLFASRASSRCGYLERCLLYNPLHTSKSDIQGVTGFRQSNSRS
nr:hypothetical protein CFP56_44394 [Quercus suber]